MKLPNVETRRAASLLYPYPGLSATPSPGKGSFGMSARRSGQMK